MPYAPLLVGDIAPKLSDVGVQGTRPVCSTAHVSFRTAGLSGRQIESLRSSERRDVSHPVFMLIVMTCV